MSQSEADGQFELFCAYYAEPQLSLPFLRRAAEAGHPVAQVNRALFAELQGSRADADRWLRRAADAGEEVAKKILGDKSGVVRRLMVEALAVVGPYRGQTNDSLLRKPTEGG